MSDNEIDVSSSDEPCERCGFFPCDCSDPGRVDPWTGKRGPTTAEQVEAFLPDEEIVPCHQPEEDVFEEPLPVFVRTEAEKDVALRAILKKPIARMAVGGKAPKSSKREREVPRGQGHGRQASLDEYFNAQETEVATRITQCRSYASYLASMQPKKQKK